MTIKERDSLKVGDEITVISKPYTWQGVNGTSSRSGGKKVSYPYTCKISKINLYQSSPAFNCENNYGWCITNEHLKYYEIKKYTPKVGDWVVITKGSNWTASMDKFIGKTVKITDLTYRDAIDFKESGVFTWKYSQGAYRPATKEEIDKLTSNELPENWAVKLDDSLECEFFKKWRDNCWDTPPDVCKIFEPKEFVDKFINKSIDTSNKLPNCFYVDVSKGTPEQLETFATWYNKETDFKHQLINYRDLKRQKWNYYGFDCYKSRNFNREDCESKIESRGKKYMIYSIEDFVNNYLSSSVTIDTSISKWDTLVDTQKEDNVGALHLINTDPYGEVFINTEIQKESKQKIIFNHTLISPTVKIVRRNQKIKF